MTIGFDLTQFGAYPSQQKPSQPAVATPPVAAPVEATPPQPVDPNAPQTINEALTKPLDVEAHDEDGGIFEDKLKKAPGLKKSLWGIDKFASDVRPVQITGKDGKKIWVDANGNNVLDPDTGKILTKPLPASDDDRKEINFHDTSGNDTLEITK